MGNIPDRIHSATIRSSIDLARYEAGLKDKVLSMLDQLGKDLVKEIAAAGLDTPRTDWQRARMRDLLDAAEKMSADVYGQVGKLTQDELRGLVEVTGDGIVARLNKAIGADLLQPVGWTKQQIIAIADETLVFGAASGDWWSRQAVDLSQAFADQMRMGMLRGEALGDLVNRVKGIDGFLGIATRNAEALVRSSVVSVANEAHLATYRANADIMAGFEWIATLDKRTCMECAKLDGMRWTLEGAPIDASVAFPGPTLHWNDRCTQMPVTKSWEQLAKEAGGDTRLAKALDDVPPGDRASMGGPVSGNMTYESWFKGLDASSQKEILGPGRYELWSSGKVSLGKLTDQSGNTITLDQLRSK